METETREGLTVRPACTEQEAAAIVAATEVLWPRAVIEPDASSRRSPWRFSGRWWSVPLPVRRDRPWR